MKQRISILLILISLNISAQVKLDSLWKVWRNAEQPDTSRMNALQRICVQGYLYSQPDSAFYFANQLFDYALKQKSEHYQVAALNIQGASCSLRGDNIHAIDYFTRSLKITEKSGNKPAIASSFNNIGVIYNELGNYEKAKEYYEKGLRLQEELGNKNGMALSYCNLGNIYRALGQYDESIEYLENSRKIAQSIGDSLGVGIALHTLGVTYLDAGELDRAADYNLKSIPYYKVAGDDQGLMEVYNILGQVYDKKGELAKANAYNKQALEISQQKGFVAAIRESSQALFERYKKMGKYQDALQMYELYITMRDSVKNEESQKELMQQEIQYNFEKQKAIDEKEHEKELAVAAEQEQRQKVISWSISAGLLLVLLFSVFVVKRLQFTRKQKQIIEHQKNLVEEKQKEILDSITYAKRLQDAILPPAKLVEEQFPESFIIYKPKDIVAGDFYWMEIITKASDSNGKKEQIVLLAAADCTGHGVPGAMVSVVCSNALNRAVLEFGITDPGKILDKTRELVLETFAKSDKDVKDGMDISLAAVDLNTREIRWAGANNPLWYIQNTELKEIRADKQPIGSSINTAPFTTHKIALSKGDMFFLFTDGYADQFGGDNGKKFKYKPIKEILLRNVSREIQFQKEDLEHTFEQWRSNIEQVDDVCIIGVRL
jgi:tetratricopeptide (TPR) repeat protein